jgi:hypothetical protein
LSVTAYSPPPPADVVIIDYADTLTFNTVAGYYHPWNRLDGERFLPSSDRLLHEYLRPVSWRTTARDSLTVLRRGEPLGAFPARSKPVKFDENTTLLAVHVSKPVPGGTQLRLAWEFTGERKRFPWLMLVLSDGNHLYPIIKGACAVEAGDGKYCEEWTVIFPSWLHPGTYAFFAQFYDGNEAAWQKKTPPNDPTYTLTLIELGTWEIRPGDFGEQPAK